MNATERNIPEIVARVRVKLTLNPLYSRSAEEISVLDFDTSDFVFVCFQ